MKLVLIKFLVYLKSAPFEMHFISQKLIKDHFVGFNKRFEIFAIQLIHRIVDCGHAYKVFIFVSLKAKKKMTMSYCSNCNIRIFYILENKWRPAFNKIKYIYIYAKPFSRNILNIKHSKTFYCVFIACTIFNILLRI